MAKTLVEEFTSAMKSRLVGLFSELSTEINPPVTGSNRYLSLRLGNPGTTSVLIERNWLSVQRELYNHKLPVHGSNTVGIILKDLEEAFETATKVVETIWSALRSHFEINFTEHKDDIMASIMMYVPMCGEEQLFIPFLKYQFAWLFAKGEDMKELPEKFKSAHADGIVLAGWLGRFFKKRCFGRHLLNKEWRNTVLHGIKKGLPKPGKHILEKGILDMKARLAPSTIRETPDDLLGTIEEVSREIFPQGIIYEDWNSVSILTPVSTSSSYEYSREGMGVTGTLIEESGCSKCIIKKGRVDQYGRLKDLDLSGLDHVLMPTQLGAMYYNPKKGTTGEVRFPGLLLDNEYRNLQREAIFSVEKGAAKVKPIMEPLKIRMITAGDYKSNGLYSNLQNKLWSGLQKFNQFRLTGRPVSVRDVDELLLKSPKEFKEWNSGDYSQATDNLNRDASIACIKSLSGDPITFNVLKKGLMDTYLDFGSCGVDGMEKENVEMRSGQLMGCVFSFPILCIINLACYKHALQIYLGRKLSIRELDVLVNGDDILFRTNDRFQSIWEKTIEQCGFKKSVGKNYVSSKFAVINSCYFSTTNSNVRKVPYCNMGWVTGEKKGGLDSLEEESIGSIRAQVDKTTEEWLIDPEFQFDDLKLIHRDRREGIVKRFKEQILIVRRKTIMCSGYSFGELGLGLKDFGANFFETGELDIENLCAIYQDLHRTKKATFGLTSFPQTLVPWKFLQRVNLEIDEEMKTLRRKFLSSMMKTRTRKRYESSLPRSMIQSIFKRTEQEREESLFSLGAVSDLGTRRRVFCENADTVEIYKESWPGQTSLDNHPSEVCGLEQINSLISRLEEQTRWCNERA